MLLMVDSKTSNLRSVRNAFRRIGVDLKTSSMPEQIERASALILPGVGAFEKGIKFLDETGLSDTIRSRVLQSGVPIFGICLGMQLLADESFEDGQYKGLGLIPGQVVELKPTDTDYRVPNIGWSYTNPERHGLLFPDLKVVESFYYAHSYHFQCKDEEDAAATINYSGVDVTVAVEKDNIYGVQFHPEKSQDAGLDLLYRFVRTLEE